MENINLNEIIESVDGQLTFGNSNIAVNKIGIDSRTAEVNSLFFAIKGKNFDGHDFLKEAVEKKVAAVIYSNPNTKTHYTSFNPVFIKVKNTSIALEQAAKAYKKKFTNLKTVAITGSNGKTTTKEMIASILKQRAETLNNQGNFNNRIGVPLTVFNLSYKHQYSVFELGTSEFGEIKALSEITNPDYALITNIGASHLEFFKNRENIFREKITLIDGLKTGGTVILNTDDPYLKSAVPSISKKIISFGFESGADICAKKLKLNIDKPIFDVDINGIIETFEIPVKSKFNILNALGAIAASLAMGFSVNEIRNGLKSFSPPKMRMQSLKLHNGAIAVNDAYNANPSSMKESLSCLEQSYPAKEYILVLGDMLELGDDSDEYHREIGRFINTIESVKTVYLAGDKSKYIKEQILNKKTEFFEDKEKLLIELKKELNENSVVFFKASRGIKLDIIYDKLISREI